MKIPELPELHEDMDAHGVYKAILLTKVGAVDDRAPLLFPVAHLRSLRPGRRHRAKPGVVAARRTGAISPRSGT